MSEETFDLLFRRCLGGGVGFRKYRVWQEVFMRTYVVVISSRVTYKENDISSLSDLSFPSES